MIGEVEKTVYFVRHGQSEDNAAPVFQSTDSPLSDKGKHQSAIIAKRVSQLTFEVLIASPFARSKQTAEIITKATGKYAEYSELFVERAKPTSIIGKPYADENANRLWREWEKSFHTPGLRAEDSENFDDIIVRADQALAFLKSRSEKSIVVVTHGFFLRTIVARVLLGDALSGEAFRNCIQATSDLQNTSLTVLQYRRDFEEEARWRLWIYNDHAHLAD